MNDKVWFFVVVLVLVLSSFVGFFVGSRFGGVGNTLFSDIVKGEGMVGFDKRYSVFFIQSSVTETTYAEWLDGRLAEVGGDYVVLEKNLTQLKVSFDRTPFKVFKQTAGGSPIYIGNRNDLPIGSAVTVIRDYDKATGNLKLTSIYFK